MPDRSSRKTLRNSQATGMSYRFWVTIWFMAAEVTGVNAN
jgi:hypothetical protein